ncbi:hypothetical protein [Pseudomonas orientalis]|uniref:hypothetical protein n=1 Tax=Pseudomonas orientalis TaxID=76758 RepID=UPI00320A8960
MKLGNNTRNQHFLSQSEQRLNAMNPAASQSKQKMYCFEVLDREKFIVRPFEKKTVKIENTLSIDDLYSFQVEDKVMRHNFEELFKKYETQISAATKRLERFATSYPEGITQEDYKSLSNDLLYILITKQYNSFRNPYNIKKTLRILQQSESLWPLDGRMFEICLRIISGNRPHQQHICNQLGISSDDYWKWLKGLFFISIDMGGDEPNLFDGMIKEYFKEPKFLCNFEIYFYDDKSTKGQVLLPDTGAIVPSLHFPAWVRHGFNLSANAFLYVGFTHISQLTSDQNEINGFDNKGRRQIRLIKNEISALHTYNRQCVAQARQYVYCASPQPLGVEILG